jgi:hypothetical protein
MNDEITTARELLADEWGAEFSHRIKRAIAFIQSSDNLRQQFASAPDHAKADLLALAWQGARNAGTEPIALNQSPREPDMRPTDRFAAKRELDALLSEFAPGSPDYTSHYVQAEVRRLNERIHGAGPIVGQSLRTV